MNNLFPLKQISRTGNLDANSILRQHKLDLMARYVEIKSITRKMKQKELARELGFSSFTFQRYRQDRKMHSPYKSNKPKKKRQMTSNDLKRPQMISKEPAIDSVKYKRKSKLEGGNPNDPHPSNGRDLIEQTSSST